MNRAVAYSAHAPLMGVSGASAPPGGQGDWFRGAGGLRLRAAFWTPSALVAEKPLGTVIVSPGRTEPIEKYFETVGNLLARGWCVLVHDWRGQGLSARLLPDRLKGHARAVEEFLDDYARLLDAYETRAPRPWIALGHSMGATLNLLTLQSGEDRVAGLIASSPMLRIKTGGRSMWSTRFAVRWNIRHGKAGDYVLDNPDDPFDHSFEQNALTSDQARYDLWRQQLYACPHLAVGGPTWGWLAFAIEACERAVNIKALKRVRRPVAIVAAGDDVLVWKRASARAAAQLPNGRYVELPGARHEILLEAEPYREAFLAEFDALSRLVLSRNAPQPDGRSDDAEAQSAPAPPAPIPSPPAPGQPTAHGEDRASGVRPSGVEGLDDAGSEDEAFDIPSPHAQARPGDGQGDGRGDGQGEDVSEEKAAPLTPQPAPL